MQVATTIDGDNGMVVKRLSVPMGLEELMESLTKQVLLNKPTDIYSFASEHFAKLLNIRDKGLGDSTTPDMDLIRDSTQEIKQSLKIKSATVATKFNKLPTPIIFANSKSVQPTTPKPFYANNKKETKFNNITPRSVERSKSTRSSSSDTSLKNDTQKQGRVGRARWKKQETPRKDVMEKSAPIPTGRKIETPRKVNNKAEPVKKVTDKKVRETYRIKRDLQKSESELNKPSPRGDNKKRSISIDNSRVKPKPVLTKSVTVGNENISVKGAPANLNNKSKLKNHKDKAMIAAGVAAVGAPIAAKLLSDSKKKSSVELLNEINGDKSDKPISCPDKVESFDVDSSIAEISDSILQHDSLVVGNKVETKDDTVDSDFVDEDDKDSVNNSNTENEDEMKKDLKDDEKVISVENDADNTNMESKLLNDVNFGNEGDTANLDETCLEDKEGILKSESVNRDENALVPHRDETEDIIVSNELTSQDGGYKIQDNAETQKSDGTAEVKIDSKSTVEGNKMNSTENTDDVEISGEKSGEADIKSVEKSDEVDSNPAKKADAAESNSREEPDKPSNDINDDDKENNVKNGIDEVDNLTKCSSVIEDNVHDSNDVGSNKTEGDVDSLHLGGTNKETIDIDDNKPIATPSITLNNNIDEEVKDILITGAKENEILEEDEKIKDILLTHANKSVSDLESLSEAADASIENNLQLDMDHLGRNIDMDHLSPNIDNPEVIVNSDSNKASEIASISPEDINKQDLAKSPVDDAGPLHLEDLSKYLAKQDTNELQNEKVTNDNNEEDTDVIDALDSGIFGNAVKPDVPHEIEVLNSSTHHSAATKIQSVWRGHTSRKGREHKMMNLQAPAECDELSHQRGLDGGETIKAATIIQAFIRGHLVRKQFKMSEPNLSNDKLDTVIEEPELMEEGDKIDDNKVIEAMEQLEPVPEHEPSVEMEEQKFKIEDAGAKQHLQAETEEKLTSLNKNDAHESDIEEVHFLDKEVEPDIRKEDAHVLMKDNVEPVIKENVPAKSDDQSVTTNDEVLTNEATIDGNIKAVANDDLQSVTQNDEAITNKTGIKGNIEAITKEHGQAVTGNDEQALNNQEEIKGNINEVSKDDSYIVTEGDEGAITHEVAMNGNELPTKHEATSNEGKSATTSNATIKEVEPTTAHEATDKEVEMTMAQEERLAVRKEDEHVASDINEQTTTNTIHEEVESSATKRANDIPSQDEELESKVGELSTTKDIDTAVTSVSKDIDSEVNDQVSTKEEQAVSNGMTKTETNSNEESLSEEKLANINEDNNTNDEADEESHSILATISEKVNQLKKIISGSGDTNESDIKNDADEENSSSNDKKLDTLIKTETTTPDKLNAQNDLLSEEIKSDENKSENMKSEDEMTKNVKDQKSIEQKPVDLSSEYENVDNLKSEYRKTEENTNSVEQKSEDEKSENQKSEDLKSDPTNSAVSEDQKSEELKAENHTESEDLKSDNRSAKLTRENLSDERASKDGKSAEQVKLDASKSEEEISVDEKFENSKSDDQSKGNISEARKSVEQSDVYSENLKEEYNAVANLKPEKSENIPFEEQKSQDQDIKLIREKHATVFGEVDDIHKLTHISNVEAIAEDNNNAVQDNEVVDNKLVNNLEKNGDNVIVTDDIKNTLIEDNVGDTHSVEANARNVNNSLIENNLKEATKDVDSSPSGNTKLENSNSEYNSTKVKSEENQTQSDDQNQSSKSIADSKELDGSFPESIIPESAISSSESSNLEISPLHVTSKEGTSIDDMKNTDQTLNQTKKIEDASEHIAITDTNNKAVISSDDGSKITGTSNNLNATADIEKLNDAEAHIKVLESENIISPVTQSHESDQIDTSPNSELNKTAPNNELINKGTTGKNEESGTIESEDISSVPVKAESNAATEDAKRNESIGSINETVKSESSGDIIESSSTQSKDNDSILSESENKDAMPLPINDDPKLVDGVNQDTKTSKTKGESDLTSGEEGDTNSPNQLNNTKILEGFIKEDGHVEDQSSNILKISSETQDNAIDKLVTHSDSQDILKDTTEQAGDEVLKDNSSNNLAKNISKSDSINGHQLFKELTIPHEADIIKTNHDVPQSEKVATHHEENDDFKNVLDTTNSEDITNGNNELIGASGKSQEDTMKSHPVGFDETHVISNADETESDNLRIDHVKNDDDTVLKSKLVNSQLEQPEEKSEEGNVSISGIEGTPNNKDSSSEDEADETLNTKRMKDYSSCGDLVDIKNMMEADGSKLSKSDREVTDDTMMNKRKKRSIEDEETNNSNNISQTVEHSEPQMIDPKDNKEISQEKSETENILSNEIINDDKGNVNNTKASDEINLDNNEASSKAINSIRNISKVIPTLTDLSTTNTYTSKDETKFLTQTNAASKSDTMSETTGVSAENAEMAKNIVITENSIKSEAPITDKTVKSENDVKSKYAATTEDDVKTENDVIVPHALTSENTGDKHLPNHTETNEDDAMSVDESIGNDASLSLIDTTDYKSEDESITTTETKDILKQIKNDLINMKTLMEDDTAIPDYTSSTKDNTKGTVTNNEHTNNDIVSNEIVKNEITNNEITNNEFIDNELAGLEKIVELEESLINDEVSKTGGNVSPIEFERLTSTSSITSLDSAVTVIMTDDLNKLQNINKEDNRSINNVAIDNNSSNVLQGEELTHQTDNNNLTKQEMIENEDIFLPDLINAVTKIQSMFRGYSVRNKIATHKDMNEKNQIINAAIRRIEEAQHEELQKIINNNKEMDPKYIADIQHAAATTIQKHVRGHLVRNNNNNNNNLKDNEKDFDINSVAAAIKIQRAFKSFLHKRQNNDKSELNNNIILSKDEDDKDHVGPDDDGEGLIKENNDNKNQMDKDNIDHVSKDHDNKGLINENKDEEEDSKDHGDRDVDCKTLIIENKEYNDMMGKDADNRNGVGKSDDGNDLNIANKINKNQMVKDPKGHIGEDGDRKGLIYENYDNKNQMDKYNKDQVGKDYDNKSLINENKDEEEDSKDHVDTDVDCKSLIIENKEYNDMMDKDADNRYDVGKNGDGNDLNIANKINSDQMDKTPFIKDIDGKSKNTETKDNDILLDEEKDTTNEMQKEEVTKELSREDKIDQMNKEENNDLLINDRNNRDANTSKDDNEDHINKVKDIEVKINEDKNNNDNNHDENHHQISENNTNHMNIENKKQDIHETEDTKFEISKEEASNKNKNKAEDNTDLITKDEDIDDNIKKVEDKDNNHQINKEGDNNAQIQKEEDNTYNINNHEDIVDKNNKDKVNNNQIKDNNNTSVDSNKQQIYPYLISEREDSNNNTNKEEDNVKEENNKEQIKIDSDTEKVNKNGDNKNQLDKEETRCDQTNKEEVKVNQYQHDSHIDDKPEKPQAACAEDYLKNNEDKIHQILKDEPDKDQASEQEYISDPLKNDNKHQIDSNNDGKPDINQDEVGKDQINIDEDNKYNTNEENQDITGDNNKDYMDAVYKSKLHINEHNNTQIKKEERIDSKDQIIIGDDNKIDNNVNKIVVARLVNNALKDNGNVDQIQIHEGNEHQRDQNRDEDTSDATHKDEHQMDGIKGLSNEVNEDHIKIDSENRAGINENEVNINTDDDNKLLIKQNEFEDVDNRNNAQNTQVNKNMINPGKIETVNDNYQINKEYDATNKPQTKSIDQHDIVQLNQDDNSYHKINFDNNLCNDDDKKSQSNNIEDHKVEQLVVDNSKEFKERNIDTKIKPSKPTLEQFLQSLGKTNINSEQSKKEASNEITIEVNSPKVYENNVEPFYLHEPNKNTDNPISAAIRVSSHVTNQEPSISLLHSGEYHDTPVNFPPTNIQVVVQDQRMTSRGSTPTSPVQLLHSGELHDVLVPQVGEAPAGVATVTLDATAATTAATTAAAGDGAHASRKDDSARTPADNEFGVASSVLGMEGKRNNATIIEKNMESEAATKIQASFRGYQVRKQLKTKNSNDVISSRRSARRKSSGKAIDGKKLPKKEAEIEERSATKIQAGVRGFLVRRRHQKNKKDVCE